MDFDADVDAAAEDPPLTWLAVAVAGLAVAVIGLVAFALHLLGASDAVVGAVPALETLFSASPFVVVFGVGLFVLAMTEWSPDLDA